jgi:hypothetical protein
VRIPYQLTLVGLGLVVCAATVFVARINPGRGVNLARGAVVSQSSRDPSVPTGEGLVDGELWNSGAVTREQDQPWIQVDLRRPQSISEVLIYNRTDGPCHIHNRAGGMEHSSPLVLELSRDGRAFQKVAEHAGPFEVWDQPIQPQTARFMRVRLMRRDVLSLREIEVH